jgi:hypothetical protein
MIEVPDEFKKFIGIKDLKKLPDGAKRYKCPICYLAGFTTKECPDCCSKDTFLMCPIDHTHCSHPITEVLAYCPICDAPICSVCGSHDVTQVSRVTGYLADVDGMNNGKKQEVKDRHRVNIATVGENEDF